MLSLFRSIPPSLGHLDPGHHWVSLTLGFGNKHSLSYLPAHIFSPSDGGKCALDCPSLKVQYQVPPCGEGEEAKTRSQRLFEASHQQPHTRFAHGRSCLSGYGVLSRGTLPPYAQMSLAGSLKRKEWKDSGTKTFVFPVLGQVHMWVCKLAPQPRGPVGCSPVPPSGHT